MWRYLVFCDLSTGILAVKLNVVFDSVDVGLAALPRLRTANVVGKHLQVGINDLIPKYSPPVDYKTLARLQNAPQLTTKPQRDSKMPPS